MWVMDDGERFLLSMDNAGSSLSFSLTGNCRRLVVIAGDTCSPELMTSPELDAVIAAAVRAPVVNW